LRSRGERGSATSDNLKGSYFFTTGWEYAQGKTEAARSDQPVRTKIWGTGDDEIGRKKANPEERPDFSLAAFSRRMI
jgi:hypothetical protein